MNINEFDYQLPKELIAQRPLKDRDQCRLMILDRQEKSIEQKKFYDVLEYLKPGDCIVMNDSKAVSYTHLTNILTSFTPPLKGAGVMLEGDGKAATDKLAGILSAKHLI